MGGSGYFSGSLGESYGSAQGSFIGVPGVGYGSAHGSFTGVPGASYGSAHGSFLGMPGASYKASPYSGSLYYMNMPWMGAYYGDNYVRPNLDSSQRGYNPKFDMDFSRRGQRFKLVFLIQKNIRLTKLFLNLKVQFSNVGLRGS